MRRFVFALFMAAGAGLVLVQPASAHCDSMDGPVVQAAQEALAAGDVTPVLKWVSVEDEAEIREAFGHTLRVRALDPEAREVADRWFFETLVRVHRAGEGAPYTGLKPAGAAVDEGIEAADIALETGSIDRLASDVSNRAGALVHERFERVQALAAHADHNVEAGREYVHAYVEYIHFIEALQGLLTHGAGEVAPAATHAH